MKAILGFFLNIYIMLFRMTKGRIGGKMAGMDVLILDTVGRKSGKNRLAPLGYLTENGDYIITASNAGGPKNPGWYYNLKNNPDARIELKGGETMSVHAEEADSKKRDELWKQVVAKSPGYGKYESKTERTIPIMILHPQA
jgi:deazaflavin-dependent oxidoreductase (nitroreductase family)